MVKTVILTLIKLLAIMGMAYCFKTYQFIHVPQFSLFSFGVGSALLLAAGFLSIYYKRSITFHLSLTTAGVLIFHSLTTEKSIGWALIVFVVPIAFLWTSIAQDRPVNSKSSKNCLVLVSVIFAVSGCLLLTDSFDVIDQDWIVSYVLNLAPYLTSTSFLFAWLSSVACLIFIICLFEGRFLSLYIFIINSFGMVYPSIEILAFCSISSALILIGVEIIHMEKIAYYDQLTEIPGRRALMKKLDQISGTKCILAMLDVDHFKKFNDTYGHDVGDDVLRVVAKFVGKVDGGFGYRYGGEEFTVVFHHGDIKKAYKSLDNVRLNIQNYVLKLRDQANRPKDIDESSELRDQSSAKIEQCVSVTISAGMAESWAISPKPEFSKTSDKELDRLLQTLEYSDKALYSAKRNGRNQIQVASV